MRTDWLRWKQQKQRSEPFFFMNKDKSTGSITEENWVNKRCAHISGRGFNLASDAYPSLKVIENTYFWTKLWNQYVPLLAERRDCLQAPADSPLKCFKANIWNEHVPPKSKGNPSVFGQPSRWHWYQCLILFLSVGPRTEGLGKQMGLVC